MSAIIVAAAEAAGYPGDAPSPYELLRAARQAYADVYAAAEQEYGRPLQPGDPSPCCLGDRLLDFNGELVCPGCGHRTLHLVEVAA